jgi:hypothetical protein
MRLHSHQPEQRLARHLLLISFTKPAKDSKRRKVTLVSHATQEKRKKRKESECTPN